MKALSSGLGSNDRNKVSEYLDNIREIERRIQLAEKHNNNQDINVPSAPIGIPDDHVEHSKLMLDLMVLAFQSDITRVSTFMMAREVSYRTFNNIGIPDAFHPTSHHQNDPEKLEKLTRINTYHVSLIAGLMEPTRSVATDEARTSSDDPLPHSLYPSARDATTNGSKTESAFTPRLMQP